MSLFEYDDIVAVVRGPHKGAVGCYDNDDAILEEDWDECLDDDPDEAWPEIRQSDNGAKSFDGIVIYRERWMTEAYVVVPRAYCRKATAAEARTYRQKYE